MKKRFAGGGSPNPNYGKGRSEPYMQLPKEQQMPAVQIRVPRPTRQYEEPLPDNALFGIERDSDVQRSLEADELGSDIGPDITDRANKPYRKGGKVKKMARGGSVSSASKRADGIAQRGKTKGRFV